MEHELTKGPVMKTMAAFRSTDDSGRSASAMLQYR